MTRAIASGTPVAVAKGGSGVAAAVRTSEATPQEGVERRRVAAVAKRSGHDAVSGGVESVRGAAGLGMRALVEAPDGSPLASGARALGAVAALPIEHPEAAIVNHGRNVEVHNQGIVRPKTLAELQEAVALAPKVRPMGRNMSFNTQLSNVEGIHLDMRAFDSVELAADQQSVWLGGGGTFAHANEILSEQGLALRNAPMMDEVSIAGGMSTASHGTGLRYGSFSDDVLEMEVLDSAGRLHRLTDEEDLRAARAALGTGGVIWRVRARVVPDEQMVAREDAVFGRDVEAAFDRFIATAQQHDRADFFYFPGDNREAPANGALYRTFDPYQPSRDGQLKPLNKVFGYLKEHVAGEWLATQLLTQTVAHSKPSAKHGDGVKDAMSKLSIRTFWDRGFTLPRSKAAHYFPGHVHVVTMEYSMPFERAHEVKAAIDQAIAETGFVPEMAFYFRMLGETDNTLLSPSTGRKSIIVESYQFHTKYSADPQALSAEGKAEMLRTGEFMQVLESKLMALGGRAHPGKILHQSQRSQYPAGTFEKFDAFRRKMDPQGKFLNEWAAGYLGLGDEDPKLPARVGGVALAASEAYPNQALVDAVSSSELGLRFAAAWKDSRRALHSPLVREQERLAQTDRLLELLGALAARGEGLKLEISRGTLPLDAVARARATLASVVALAEDLQVMARPLGTADQVAQRAKQMLGGT